MRSTPPGRERLSAVTRDRPCPVCGATHGCTRGADGLIICRKRSGPQPGFVHLGQSKQDNQWGLYRAEGDPCLDDDRPPRYSPSRNGHQRADTGADWDGRMRAQEQDLTPERRAELAAALGLPEAALAVLRVGYLPSDPAGPCWTFAEMDAAGAVIGISRRYEDARKQCVVGSARGLTIPNGWRDRDGPVFVVEGPSCALAATAIGLAAVGRPSNTGGVEHLAQLLRDLPADREIVVVGEHDAKADGRWPGLDGARRVAAGLQERLGRPVQWVLPPAGAKDLRAWVLGRHLDTALADEWQELGSQLLAEWRGKYQGIDGEAEVQPPGSPFRFEVLTSADFAAADYRREWLIRRLLVRGQPAVMGGPRKSLKTSLLIDLAVSLGTATPFLGEFPVYRRARVAVLSAESGDATLQETALRVCAARGIELATADVLWGFALPRLCDTGDLAALRHGLAEHQIEVLILDPLYLALLSGQGPGGPRAESLYDMGHCS